MEPPRFADTAGARAAAVWSRPEPERANMTPTELLAALRAAAAAGDREAAAFLPMFAAWALSSLPAAGRC